MKKPTEKARALLDNYCSFSIKWTTSRARDTYGYTVCTLYLNRYSGTEEKAARCNGGGYDLAGTVFGSFLRTWFKDDFKKLSSSTGSGDPWNHKNAYYGLYFYDVKRRKYRKNWRPGYTVYVDGGTGFSCMEHLLNAVGVTLTYKRISSREDLYIFNLATKKAR